MRQLLARFIQPACLFLFQYAQQSHFSPHVLFKNSEMTSLLFYWESAVLYAACCTRVEEDKE